MAKRRNVISDSLTPVSPERGVRLYRLVTLLGEKPQTRLFLTRRLSVGVRDFYRDLEILRKAGVEIHQEHGKYNLQMELTTAQASIPFPNPCLTLGQAEQLARGRSAAHKRLKNQVELIKSAEKPRSRKMQCID